jgi:hypothetical protein
MLRHDEGRKRDNHEGLNQQHAYQPTQLLSHVTHTMREFQID